MGFNDKLVCDNQASFGLYWDLLANASFSSSTYTKQLGLGHRFSQHHPQLIRSLEQEFIIQTACGQQHSLALTLHGDVYSWGLGSSITLLIYPGLVLIVVVVDILGVFGQLGHNECSDENMPKKIAFKHPTNESEAIRIVQIACGSHHSLALDSLGRVWSWGSSEYAQQFQSEAKYYDDWVGH